MTLLEELEEKCAETDFAAATCGLTILRCGTVSSSALPGGVSTHPVDCIPPIHYWQVAAALNQALHLPIMSTPYEVTQLTFEKL